QAKESIKVWDQQVYQSQCFEKFNLEVIEFEYAQNNTTAKLPILKLGEYEMWVIRIKQYFQVQDYALWEVIENGNSWVSVLQTTQENGVLVTKMSVPVTAEENTNKKNDVKARSLLLMALPNEHQLTFLQLQKIVSMLANLGVISTQEDLNSKFLRSLPPEWNTHVVFWMNKDDIETMSIDDLYNNFKIIKQDVKKSVSASTGAQNIAFMTASSTTSTNDVNTANPAYEASTISPNDLEQIHEDDLEAMNLRWQLSLLSKRAKRKQGNNKDTFSKAMLAIDGVGYDWSDMAEEHVQTNMALMAFSDSKCDDLIAKLNQTEFTAATYKRGLATVEEQLVTYKKNKVLFNEEVEFFKRKVACKDYETNLLKNEFKEPEFKGYDPRDSKLKSNIFHDQKSNDSKENSNDSFVKEQVSENTSSFVKSPLNVDKETSFSVDKKIEFVKPKHHEKPFRKSVRAPMSQDRGRREIYKQGSKKKEQAPKALMAIDRLGWDWSYMANVEENHALVADEEAPTKFALMAKSSSCSENEVFDNSLCSKACKKIQIA
nr:hypothetical protein [Tanacetum cinerariifolium]